MISLKVTSTIQKTEKWSIEKWEKGKRKGTYFKRKEKEKFEKEDKEQDKGDDKNKMLNNQQEDKKEEERSLKNASSTRVERQLGGYMTMNVSWRWSHWHQDIIGLRPK